MKNYTSTVDAAVTIARIEAALVRFGARHIAKDYLLGEVVGITFSIDVEGVAHNIRLPANVDLVRGVLSKRKHSGAIATWEKRMSEQARRTAWKLMQDWVEVQLSLVEMKQAEAAQVFMPYFWDGKTTLFQVLKSKQFLAIGHKEKEPA